MWKGETEWPLFLLTNAEAQLENSRSDSSDADLSTPSELRLLKSQRTPCHFSTVLREARPESPALRNLRPENCRK